MISRSAKLPGLLCALVALTMSGCMFDVVSVKQTPAAFVAGTPTPRRMQLLLEVKASLGTGFPTWLKTGTTWKQIGRIAEGDVFATSDQIVTVEASNIHEANIV